MPLAGAAQVSKRCNLTNNRFALECYRYQWEPKGPFNMSGAIRHILVDPVDNHRLYAASENGGLWVLDDDRKPDDGWRPLTDELDNLQMRGVAKSSVDQNYIVTANASGFLYHSKNRGATWSKVTDRNFDYIRRILLADTLTRDSPGRNFAGLTKKTRLWVASNTGLFRIRLVNDMLPVVERLYPQTEAQERFPDVLDVVRNQANGDLYIGVRGQGVWKYSENAANSSDAWTLSADWATFGDNASPMIKLAIMPDGSRIVAKLGRNVLTNDAAGDPAGWVKVVQVPFGNDVGGSDIGYRGNYSGSRGEWTHAIAISPVNRDLIVAGQVELFVSTTGGRERPCPPLSGALSRPACDSVWMAAKARHEDMQSLAFSPDGAALYIANDGGVFRHAIPFPLLPAFPAIPTTFPTGSPAGLNTKLTTAQFYRAAMSGNVVVANADHQGIRGTADIEASSVIWQRATPDESGFGRTGLENDFVSGDSSTPNRFFVLFHDLHLLRLKYPPVDETPAENLLPINPTDTPLRPYEMNSTPNTRAKYNQLNYPVGTIAVDPRAGKSGKYIVLASVHVSPNQTYGIQMTTDANVDPSGGPRIECRESPPAPPQPVGGCFTTPVEGTANWSAVFGPTSTPIVSIAFSPSEPGKAYALDESGAVFVLANVDDDDPAPVFEPARGFDAIDPDFARQIIADPTTPGRLFALSHGQILTWTDSNAENWTRIGQGSLPDVQFNCLVLHPRRSRVMYLATAAGVYASVDRGANWYSIGDALPNVSVMQVFTSETHLYAVTFGRGLWRTKLPE